MHLDQYVLRMGRRAARHAQLGGAEGVRRVHAEMCKEVAAAHGFKLEVADARALCAYLTPGLLEALSAEADLASRAVEGATGGLAEAQDVGDADREEGEREAASEQAARTRALFVTTLTQALACALQSWLRSLGFTERQFWQLK